MARWSVPLLCCGVMLAGFMGCGSGNVVVTGQVKHQGQTYKPEAGEQVMVSFGLEKNGQVSGDIFPTRLDANGSFKLAGAYNQGIPPGKYRVSVMSMPEVPVPGQAMTIKFPSVADIHKSPVSVEITSSKRTANIEIP